MGANELSAAPSQVKRIRHLIRRLRRGELIPHVQDILTARRLPKQRRLEALAGELEFC
jgi:phosphoenolpyruvate-protein kinase (PTS system EI component)